MGSCFSSASASSLPADSSSPCEKPSSAFVVSVTGQLRQYPVPVTVSQVLDTTDHQSFFLCNSDRLHFDDYIPCLLPEEELQPAQIYFLLPTSRLRHRLPASDMAALAVKASVALQQIDAASNCRGGNRKSRISPVLMSEEDHTQTSNHEINQLNMITNHKKKISRSASVIRRSNNNNKLTRQYSSRRAKLSIRSFRHRLSTIQEGSSRRSTSIVQDLEDKQHLP